MIVQALVLTLAMLLIGCVFYAALLQDEKDRLRDLQWDMVGALDEAIRLLESYSGRYEEIEQLSKVALRAKEVLSK